MAGEEAAAGVVDFSINVVVELFRANVGRQAHEAACVGYVSTFGTYLDFSQRVFFFFCAFSEAGELNHCFFVAEHIVYYVFSLRGIFRRNSSNDNSSSNDVALPSSVYVSAFGVSM